MVCFATQRFAAKANLQARSETPYFSYHFVKGQVSWCKKPREIYLPTHSGLVPVHFPSTHCLCGDPRSTYPWLQVKCTSALTPGPVDSDNCISLDPLSGDGAFEKEHPPGWCRKESKRPNQLISLCNFI